MRRHLKLKPALALLCLSISTFSFSQVTVTPESTTRAINANTYGYNNNEDFSPDWTAPATVEAVANTYAGFLRYPGGTVGNYFDWETGRGIKPTNKASYNGPAGDTYGVTGGPECETKPTEYCTGSNVSGNTLANFLKGLDAVSAIYAQRGLPRIKPIYMMNIKTSTNYVVGDLQHQIDALRTMRNAGYEPEYIQMGNELFIDRAFPDYTDMFPTPESYADHVKSWIVEIKKEFPNVKWAIPIVKNVTPYVANPPASGERNTTWARRILGRLAQSPNSMIPDAVTFHYYTTGANDGNPSAQFADLFDAYSEQNWLNYFPLPDTRHLNGPGEDKIKVWVTEWGMAGQSSAASGDQWFYALHMLGMGLLQLESPRLEISTCHVIFAGSSWSNLQTTAPYAKQNLGWGTYMLNKMTLGKTEARRLAFTPNTQLTGYPALYGWEFSKANKLGREQVIINFSNTNQTISTTGLGVTSYEQLAKDPLFVVNSTDALFASSGGQKTGSTTSQMVLPPYSITRLYNQNVLETADASIAAGTVKVSPNPGTGVFAISASSAIEKFEVSNALGNILLTGTGENMDLTALQSGVYHVRILVGGTWVMKKIILTK